MLSVLPVSLHCFLPTTDSMGLVMNGIHEHLSGSYEYLRGWELRLSSAPSFSVFPVNKPGLTVITGLQNFPAGRNVFGTGRGFFPKYLFFSICFYLVLPLPSREGVQCNSFPHIMASGGLFLLVFDRCHLFTNGINCLSAASTEPEQIQNNLGVSFPALAVELYLAFATWFAFCRTSCLHDQLTCFTNIFLATAYKLAFFIFGKEFLKKKPKVLFCFGLLCNASLMAQGACKVLFCCLALSPIITVNPAALILCFQPTDCPFSALLPLQHPTLGSWNSIEKYLTAMWAAEHSEKAAASITSMQETQVCHSPWFWHFFFFT